MHLRDFGLNKYNRKRPQADFISQAGSIKPTTSSPMNYQCLHWYVLSLTLIVHWLGRLEVVSLISLLAKTRLWVLYYVKWAEGGENIIPDIYSWNIPWLL